MHKKAQLNILSNPKNITFILGGAIIGYLLFQTLEAAIFGGITGFIVSLIR